MTEQEYCDVSDLDSAYIIANILRNMNCFQEPMKTQRMSCIANINLLIAELQDKLNVD